MTVEPITDDGWIAWSGGERPVPAGTSVSVRLRSDRKDTPALEMTAGELRWSHHGLTRGAGAGDIIAYRVRIISPVPDTPEVAALKAEIAALKARVVPEARIMKDDERLAPGVYLRRCAHWKHDEWESFLINQNGENISIHESALRGTYIVGPLPLPALPSEETDNG